MNFVSECKETEISTPCTAVTRGKTILRMVIRRLPKAVLWAEKNDNILDIDRHRYSHRQRQRHRYGHRQDIDRHRYRHIDMDIATEIDIGRYIDADIDIGINI